ncbi:MAG: SRPBCC domain-containing protein [Spirochaetales bacterium]|nr:SRPBCC domain-containing protein [Spirochaetales bacterium]
MIRTLFVTTKILSSMNLVWELWTNSQYRKNWYFASQDWHCPQAESEFVVGGKFLYRMEDKKERIGFHYSGTFTRILPHSIVESELDDGRVVKVTFEECRTGVRVTEFFEADVSASAEIQQKGWQAILNNFKSYVECQDSVKVLEESVH